MAKVQRVIFLTSNENTNHLYEWLSQRVTVWKLTEKLTLDIICNWKPDLIVSYNYSFIIRKDVIDYMNGNIINLHISYLPWNKGASPNFWSFVDDTPKGVSIHKIVEKLDAGNILYQKEMFFDENVESFQSTYDKLQTAIMQLFIEKWNEIQSGNYVEFRQKEKGTYHTMRDLKVLREQCPFEWKDNIAEYLQKYRTKDFIEEKAHDCNSR